MIASAALRTRTAIVWFAVVLFLVLFGFGAWKPLHLDDMDFPAVAQATAEKGVPVYYRGEQNPNALGIYHPPLYIYLLALWFKLFGAGPAQARLFGAACVLLQGLCVLLLLGELFGRRYVRTIAPWFWVLFLLNTYTIQTAAIADIDSTIYGPLLLVFLWTILRMSWRDGTWRTDPLSGGEAVLAALALMMCLWAKLTTVWLVLPFGALLLVGRFGWLRALRLGALIAGGGVLGFLATYWLYGKLAGLPVSFTFTFTLASLLSRGSSGGSGLGSWLGDRIRNAEFMVSFLIGWTGLVPWVGVAAGIGSGLWWWFRRKEFRSLHAALLLLIAALSTAYYCAQTMTFGASPFKYTYPYWGVAVAAAVVAGLPPQGTWRRISLGAVAVCAGVWLAACVAGARVVQDKAFLVTSDRAALRWALVVPALVFVAGLFLQARGKSISGGALAAVGLVLYGGLQAGTAVYQNSQDYATTYDYGQRGFQDTVGYIRTRTDANDLIVSMKDIGYAAQRRYFENYAAVYGYPAEMQQLEALLASGGAKLAVFTEGRGQDQLVVNPPLRDWVTSRCRLLASFGNYRIYGGCAEPLAAQP